MRHQLSHTLDGQAPVDQPRIERLGVGVLMLPQVVVLDQFQWERQLSRFRMSDLIVERPGQYSTGVFLGVQDERTLTLTTVVQVVFVGAHWPHDFLKRRSGLVVVDDEDRLDLDADGLEHLLRKAQVHHDDMGTKDFYRQLFTVLVSQVLGRLTVVSERRPGRHDTVVTATVVEYNDRFGHDGLRSVRGRR
ncbi:hypothetical protein D3C81_1132670 [compost metagenome]